MFIEALAILEEKTVSTEETNSLTYVDIKQNTYLKTGKNKIKVIYIYNL